MSKKIRKISNSSKISMAPTFLRLLNNALCIVGNSSVAIREASFLGVMAVNIGTRQSGRLRGANIIDVSYDRAEILLGVKSAIAAKRVKSSNIYGDGKAGVRIADILASTELSTDKKIAY